MVEIGRFRLQAKSRSFGGLYGPRAVFQRGSSAGLPSGTGSDISNKNDSFVTVPAAPQLKKGPGDAAGRASGPAHPFQAKGDRPARINRARQRTASNSRPALQADSNLQPRRSSLVYGPVASRLSPDRRAGKSWICSRPQGRSPWVWGSINQQTK